MSTIRENSRILEKPSLPGESAGTGAFLIAGYYTTTTPFSIAVTRARTEFTSSNAYLQPSNAPATKQQDSNQLTEVVRTPHGSAGVVAEASGVSINSKPSGDSGWIFGVVIAPESYAGTEIKEGEGDKEK